jgi:Uma2 family endonuclease
MINRLPIDHSLTQADDAYIPPELIELTHQLVTPKQFEQLCAKYSDMRLELTSTGELIAMTGTGGETGRSNADLTYQLRAWTRIDGRGVCFDSSTMFALPNNARRSPDASWIRRERWDSLTLQQKRRFVPVCPDFVAELRSPSDRLRVLFDKMSEYIANGASLGWLIDPSTRRVYVYRPHEDVLVFENPETVSGEPLLPGFTLNLSEMW